jgi:hypothetical protein
MAHVNCTHCSKTLFINMYSCVDGEYPIAGARYQATRLCDTRVLRHLFNSSA